MKSLIIGTTCLDVICNLDHLPSTMGDVNCSDFKVAMGGMAYNVFQPIEKLTGQAILASPIGEGKLADLMYTFFKEKGLEPFAQVKGQDNGACLCLVEENGERTFISYHGAEYKFDASWYDKIDFNDIDYIYVSGLEVEDDKKYAIYDFLKEKNKPFFFAPGARIMNIEKEKMDKYLALSPIVHLNEEEANSYTNSDNYVTAANKLFEKTKNTVIITLGPKGAYLKTSDEEVLVAGLKAEVVDTIGAGDGHVGSVIAGLKLGMNFKEAISLANTISAKIVAKKGAGLLDEAYLAIKEELCQQI